MATQYISHRNLRFLLHEVFEAHQLNRFSYYQDYDKEAFDLALDAAKQIADTTLFPFFAEMDKKKAHVENGKVWTHPQLKKLIQTIAEGGWISAHAPYEWGGQQMPLMLQNAGLLTFYAANICACYPFLTQGAANLILSFASEELKQIYIPKMFSGEWQGTMALTEPQAGSSLSDVSTTATPTDDGSYFIKGQKIYISAGDHDAAENIVHLLLARIKGAPAGTKGISLFIVPKKRLENGNFISNDVITSGIYGKMGQKGYVAAHLMYGEHDDCKGYLVGKPHHGLMYMFQMMNEARIGTGLVATGTTSAAYYAALQYANERPQGRQPSNKDATQPPILIIEHADVRRMLLFQKAIVEGSTSLLMQCSYYADIANAGEGEEKANAHLLSELLTPIAKSYPSEMGVLATKAAMQTLGGAGYCDDFPVEQYYRELPINAIYEGTTGIHGLDLLGRKIMMEKSKALFLFQQEVQKTIKKAEDKTDLKPYAEKLAKALKTLEKVSIHLMQLAQSERPEVFLADATLYLELFGIITIGWQWLLQGHKATEALSDAVGDDINFYQGKIFAMRYFFEYEMPKINALQERLMSADKLTLDLKNAYLV